VWPFISLSFIIIVIDRICKIIIFKNIPVGRSIPVIEGIFHISPAYNKGIAFGLCRSCHINILTAVSLLAIILILYIMLIKRPGRHMLMIGFSLILGGAAGNLIDRLAYGHVLDFIDLRVWPVFNIADSCITIGAGLILWNLLVTRRKRL
jgi:signal peptidase II